MSIFSVEQWANRLGKELWDLGELITKSSEIKSVSETLGEMPS